MHVSMLVYLCVLLDIYAHNTQLIPDMVPIKCFLMLRDNKPLKREQNYILVTIHF